MSLSQEIINVLNYMCQKFGIAIDWTSENVMPYLEDLCGRYIEYEIYMSIAWCAIFVAIVIGSGLIWAIAKFTESTNRSIYDFSFAVTFKYIFFCALTIGVFVWAVQVFDIIECYTIPEKTILEYLNHLINTASSR